MTTYHHTAMTADAGLEMTTTGVESRFSDLDEAIGALSAITGINAAYLTDVATALQRLASGTGERVFSINADAQTGNAVLRLVHSSGSQALLYYDGTNIYSDPAIGGSGGVGGAIVADSVRTAEFGLGLLPVAQANDIADISESEATFSAAERGKFNDILAALRRFGFIASAAASSPIAAAGADDSVAEGDTLYLDGSGSTAESGSIVSYAWTCTVKTPGTIADPNFGGTASLEQAEVTGLEVGEYTFQLAIENSYGLTDTDTVVITVTAVSTAWYELYAPVLAYQAKSAGSAATAKVNLGSSAATNDLARTAGSNADPAWSDGAGWTFVPADQDQWTTAYTPGAGGTLIVAFTDDVGSSSTYLCGDNTSGAMYQIRPNQFSIMTGKYGNGTVTAYSAGSPPADHGVVAVNATGLFVDGVLLTALTGETFGTAITPICIGNVSTASSILPRDCVVTALAFYDAILSEAQILAIYNALVAASLAT